jgi:mannose-6-phosphate isomerase
MGPSRVLHGGRLQELREVIENAPVEMLGPAVVSTFGARLPFLLKVLAAERPLSLQAHPTEAQARAGFADEERRGIPRDAPNRNYRDSAHKPELLCALTPFDALCGFRPIDEIQRIFHALAVPELRGCLAKLGARPDETGLALMFRSLLQLPVERAVPVVDKVVEACRTRLDEKAFGPAARYAVQLDKLYPNDIGVVVALMLNLVRLEPGEAIYLGAAQLHAYLHGVGIEIMASSDNVLRGGLTNKHVDAAELERILEFGQSSTPVEILRGRAIDSCEREYVTPAREFRLSVLNLSGTEAPARNAMGPEILLCTAGKACIDDASGARVLSQGHSVFVPANTRYSMRAEANQHTTVYRAGVHFT